MFIPISSIPWFHVFATIAGVNFALRKEMPLKYPTANLDFGAWERK